MTPKTELYGKAFENWVYHELSAYNLYKDRNAELSYWALPSGIEVDFIINDMEIAIESKASERIHTGHLKDLRSLSKEHTKIEKKIVVSLEKEPRLTDDKILILGPKDFVQRLWNGEIF